MNKRIITKVLISLLTVYYAYVPMSADLNESHLLNPDWSPHSRVHLVWFLTFTAIVALIVLYMVWVRDETMLTSFIGLGFNSGFLIAYLTAASYGGALSDSVGETASSGIPINLLENGVMAVIFILIIGYQLATRSGRQLTPATPANI